MWNNKIQRHPEKSINENSQKRLKTSFSNNEIAKKYFYVNACKSAKCTSNFLFMFTTARVTLTAFVPLLHENGRIVYLLPLSFTHIIQLTILSSFWNILRILSLLFFINSKSEEKNWVSKRLASHLQILYFYHQAIQYFWKSKGFPL